MEKIKNFLSNERVKGGIAIVAAVIMFYTPDQIDHIIEALLGALGIQKLVIGKK